MIVMNEMQFKKQRSPIVRYKSMIYIDKSRFATLQDLKALTRNQVMIPWLVAVQTLFCPVHSYKWFISDFHIQFISNPCALI